MDILSILIISGIIFIELLVFTLGILIRNFLDRSPTQNKVQSFMDKEINKSTISIDDTKVVLGIKTDTLKKGYDKLTESVETDQNISQSINKLKQIKG